MKPRRVYIAGTGLVCPLGTTTRDTLAALRANRCGIAPLSLFTLLDGKPLPVGEVRNFHADDSVPRTHGLALAAAEQALENSSRTPDALVIGTTTGGILTTESLLRQNCLHKDAYCRHGLGTVARYLADRLRINGPTLTVSTACSSGTVAVCLALELLRSGRVDSVLAGGADSLCRLTYFGFHSLQLVDRDGCRPLDIRRRGMAVAEGAGMLLLTTNRPEYPSPELLGAAMSCDAFHPAAPHPEGEGALRAMQGALSNAGLSPADIDYINLHGTGTPDNDRAEARGVRRLFEKAPPLSSIKGATGHSLAAAGAIEAVISCAAVEEGLLPANTGFELFDPEVGLRPQTEPEEVKIRTVLSNSFGFGGNNGSLVIGQAETFPAHPSSTRAPLRVIGCSCLSGAGDLEATLETLQAGQQAAGMVSDEVLAHNLPPARIRRLKRLPRMALSLAAACREQTDPPPSSVFMGTGWGAMSETWDFLDRLTEGRERFPSPTDFVGSVHNAPAGQVAMMLGATGPNITTSDGDYSFEQALCTADLMLKDGETSLVLGADQGHEHFSPLLDPSIPQGSDLHDGGGCLLLTRSEEDRGLRVDIPLYRNGKSTNATAGLVSGLGGRERLARQCGLVLAGIPAGARREGEEQLGSFLEQAGLNIPVLRYRDLLGEFASSSALAAVLAVSLLEKGTVPAPLCNNTPCRLEDRPGVLVLGLGVYVTGMFFTRS